MTQREQVKRLVDRAVQAHGRIDVMLNNAGLMPHSSLERGKVDDWDRMIDVNIKGVLYGIAAALPHMKAQKSGHIINVSSVAGHKVRPGSAVYAATKTAVRVHLRRAAAGGEAVQYPDHRHLARRGASPSCRRASPSPTSPRGIRDFYEKVAIPADSFARAWCCSPSASRRMWMSTRSCSGQRRRSCNLLLR